MHSRVLAVNNATQDSLTQGNTGDTICRYVVATEVCLSWYDFARVLALIICYFYLFLNTVVPIVP